MPSLLELSNFSLSVGANQLLDGVSGVHVTDGHRIALVGPNGCGKSTLLRVLAGEVSDPATHNESATYYTVSAGNILGKLSPDSKNREIKSVLLVEQDNLQWAKLLTSTDCDEEELREMTVSEALDMAAAEGDYSTVEDSEIWRRLVTMAAEKLHWDVAKYEETPIGQLSTGCAMRAYLSVALHRRDIELLLLDEPTNHLDLPSIMWLQQTILHLKKTVIFVSHDISFLDAVADTLWDFDTNALDITVSGAGFSEYQHAKHVRKEQQKAAFVQQQKRNKKLTAVADKLRLASLEGQKHEAKDHDTMQRDFKRDRAGRSGRKAKAIETLRDSAKTVERVEEGKTLKISIDSLGASNDSSLILSDAVLGHNGEALPLLPHISLRIDFGERLGLIGVNGVGKSTLLKTLTGIIPPLSGEAICGRDLRVGHLAQDHDSLPVEKSARQHVFESMKEKTMTISKVGQVLINYGLTRQQVDRPIGELNPGSRARVLLATFSLRKVNTLILDEPTNHLDSDALREVTATVNEFQGTVVVVSHSRTFLQDMKFTHLMCLSPGTFKRVDSLDQYVKVMEGDVSDVVQAACS